MPLPAEVGEALAAYLTDGRPAAGAAQRAVPDLPGPAGADPRGPGRRRRRAGLPARGPATMGPHRLRHALARQMLAHGVVLTDISQVLRHRDLATTALYAKVDLDALRQVAQPWPGTHAR